MLDRGEVLGEGKRVLVRGLLRLVEDVPEDQAPAEAGPQGGASQRRREPDGVVVGEEAESPVARLAGPEAGGRKREHALGSAEFRELERGPAADGVAADRDGVQAEV